MDTGHPIGPLIFMGSTHEDSINHKLKIFGKEIWSVPKMSDNFLVIIPYTTQLNNNFYGFYLELFTLGNLG